MWPESVGRLFLCSVPRGPSFVARLEFLAAKGKGTGFYFLGFPQPFFHSGFKLPGWLQAPDSNSLGHVPLLKMEVIASRCGPLRRE